MSAYELYKSARDAIGAATAATGRRIAVGCVELQAHRSPHQHPQILRRRSSISVTGASTALGCGHQRSQISSATPATSAPLGQSTGETFFRTLTILCSTRRRHLLRPASQARASVLGMIRCVVHVPDFCACCVQSALSVTAGHDWGRSPWHH